MRAGMMNFHGGLELRWVIELMRGVLAIHCNNYLLVNRALLVATDGCSVY